MALDTTENPEGGSAPLGSLPALQKIAIIGTAPSSRLLAPYADPSWSIWACSPGNTVGLPRIDAFFEIHSLAEMCAPDHRAENEPYLAWMRAQSFPVYMQAVNAAVPNALAFPKDELVAAFGPRFFTSSIAWMLAYAIAQKPAAIGIFGVDMAAHEEYGAQKPGCHYFIEKAVERGIQIVVPLESDLHAAMPLYGYSSGTHMGRKLTARLAEIDGKLAAMRSQADILHHNIAMHEGAREDLVYMIRTWT